MKKIVFISPIIILIILNNMVSWFKAEILTYNLLNDERFYLFVIDVLAVIILLILIMNWLLQLWLMPVLDTMSKEIKQNNQNKIAFALISIMTIYFSWASPLHDIRVTFNFKTHYNERMEVIENYKKQEEYNVKKEEIILPDNLSKLSINKKVIVDNNEYFYFYISSASHGTNNQYLVYTESSTDKFYQEGRIFWLNKLKKNWYYLGCEC